MARVARFGRRLLGNTISGIVHIRKRNLDGPERCYLLTYIQIDIALRKTVPSGDTLQTKLDGPAGGSC